MDMISHCELLSSPFLHGHVIALRADICSLVPPEQAPGPEHGPELSPRSSCFSLSSYFYASRCAAAGIMFCKEAQKEVVQTIFVVVREPPIQIHETKSERLSASQTSTREEPPPWPSSHFADIDSVVSFLSSAHRLSEEDITCRRALSAQGCDFRRWWWQPE